jgi:hypothetical protein
VPRTDDATVPFYVRLPKALHERLKREQARAKERGGYEPTLGEVARRLLEKALGAKS